MADLSSLEKMGRELKCPICLSLMKSSVSLPCNHIFCNLCILESMRTGSDCPVCKVPFHRREVRAAPHMDNLVSIYKTMELASGINIFTTQAASPAKTSEDGTCQAVEKNPGASKPKVACRGRPKGKGSSGKQCQQLEKADIKSLSKKRVHVTPYPVSETPVRPGKISKSVHSSIEPEAKRASDKSEMLVTDEQGDKQFTPFFWLREEDGDDDAPEKLSGQPTDDAFPPQKPTCFSDLKDSDDEATPIKTTASSKPVAEVFDNELFEWSQRACSPELCSTPLKKQTARHQLGGVQEKDGLTNSQPTSCNVISENAKNSNHMLSDGNAEPSRTGASRKGIRKTNKKSNRKGQRNHTKTPVCRSTGSSVDEVLEILVGSGDKLKRSNKESINGELKKPKSIGIKGSKIENEPSKHYLRKHVKMPKNQFKDSLTTEALVQHPIKSISENHEIEGEEVVLSVLPSPEKTKDSAQDEGTRTGKRGKRTRNELLSKQMKTTDVSVPKTLVEPPVNPVNQAIIQRQACNKANKNLLVSLGKKDENEEHSIDRQPSFPPVFRPKRKEDHKNNSDKLKEMGKDERVVDAAVARDSCKMPLASMESAQCESNRIDTFQTSDSLDAQNSSMTKSFDSLTGNNILRKCNSANSHIHCAFCHSPDDTEVSGEMMHYFSGKPVAADYNGGFNVIHSHKNCTEWAPDVYFEDDLAINLPAELTRSRRIKCSCCGIKGAALGCYEKSCRKSFHFTCAKLTPECRWDNENFVMLCPLHSSLKLPFETAKPDKKHRKRSTSKVELHVPLICNQDDTARKWTWPSGSPCKWVLCCSALTATEKEIISEFTRLTGISISKNWIPAVSHVIASTDENGACKRTLKFLMGILDGKWILTINWIKACMEAMEPVNEEKYEITLDTHGVSGGPKLGRLRIINKRPKLFNDFRFYFMGDFQPSYKGYLQDLVIAAGGTVLQRKPISRDQEKLLDDSTVTTFIIYSIEISKYHKRSQEAMVLDQRRAEAQYLADACGAKMAGNSWIVDSIAACKVQPLA